MLVIVLGHSSCQPGPPAESQQRVSASTRTKTGGTTATSPENSAAASGAQEQPQTPGWQTANVSDLSVMSVAQLLIVEQETKKRDQAEEEEFVLLDAINQELCEMLNRKRTECPVMKRIIPDSQEQALQCDGSYGGAITLGEIEIEIPQGDDFKGTYKLIANDLYESTSFGAAKTKIKFNHPLGGEFEAPQFIKIFKLAIRTDTEKPEVLPPMSKFTVRMEVDGVKIIERKVDPSNDDMFRSKNFEYLIPLLDIEQIKMTEICNVSQQTIEERKAKVRNAISENMVIQRTRKEEYLKTNEMLSQQIEDTKEHHKEVADRILALRAKIENRYTLLEAERNRSFKLNAELKTDISLGCQRLQPIESFEIELECSMRDNVFIANQPFPEIPFGDGKASEIAFDFGGIKFTNDFGPGGQNICNLRYFHDFTPSDDLLIGSIDRLYLRKKGADFDNPPHCKSVIPILGQWEKCEVNVHEMGVFSFSGITIYINGLKAYEKKGLNFGLDRNNLYWQDDINSNDEWTKLMQNQSCNTSQ